MDKLPDKIKVTSVRQMIAEDRMEIDKIAIEKIKELLGGRAKGEVDWSDCASPILDEKYSTKEHLKLMEQPKGFEQSHTTYEQQLRDYAIANDFSYEHCYTDDGGWEFRYWINGWSMAGIVDVLYFEIGCFMVLNAMMNILGHE